MVNALAFSFRSFAIVLLALNRKSSTDQCRQVVLAFTAKAVVGFPISALSPALPNKYELTQFRSYGALRVIHDAHFQLVGDFESTESGAIW